MSQEVINVELTGDEANDILLFDFNKEAHPEGLSVNLNSDSGQADLKEVFSNLLEIMVDKPVQLNLVINSNYSRVLYIDVCTEFIKDLNKELEQVRAQIIETLS